MSTKPRESLDNSADDETSPVKQRRVSAEISATASSSRDIMSMTEPSEDDNPSISLIPLRSNSTDTSTNSKFVSLRVRTFWTIILIAGFILVILAGHLWCGILVVFISMGIYKEIIGLKRNVEKDRKLPLFYGLRWFFYFVTLFYVLKRVLAEQLDRLNYTPIIHILLKYHNMISYSLFCLGIIGFVLTLRKYTLRYQFTQLSWTFVTLILIVTQSVAHIANIYQGLFWFLIPTSCVIINDICAYLCGIMFGKTPLIKLSPKKTWEGFIGGSICTIIWSVYISGIMQEYPFFICPENHLSIAPFTKLNAGNQQICKPHQENIGIFLNGRISMLQLHALILGIFASLVAPFGGFFASGFKRAFKIKDFGDSIPGHGGITDRFDCQIIMGMFTYIYILTYVKNDETNSLQKVVNSIHRLSGTEQKRLLQHLTSLVGKTTGIVGMDVQEENYDL
jgi:phosphatidate cytidylyltransferase